MRGNIVDSSTMQYHHLFHIGQDLGEYKELSSGMKIFRGDLMDRSVSINMSFLLPKTPGVTLVAPALQRMSPGSPLWISLKCSAVESAGKAIGKAGMIFKDLSDRISL